MSFYLFPNNSNTLDSENISFTFTKDIDNIKIYINKSLNTYINYAKKQIELYYLEWDIYKKYTNPYEYIHSIIPNNKTSVSKLKPLSRSFFKLIEIFNLLDILNDINMSKITSFHLAEGPGGFIEALSWLRNNNNDTYYGMTLINDDDNIPGWKKSQYFLNKNKNVKIEYGINNNGDLSDVENLKYCREKYKNSIDIITGDGGFDFSVDFNKQEIVSSKLILYQICFAISMQKENGIFILKFFDLFTEASVELVYLLSLCYEKIYIVKPFTSRYANSEKYIVCKKFKLTNVTNILDKLIENYSEINNNKNFLKTILNLKIPYFFLNKLEEYNAIIGQQQIENIISTINLINNSKDDKLEIIKNNNIQKCVQWCIKYKIPYYKNLSNLYI
jgi:23S rRNA U2552 (ribose-2'-O)-methylase RlmE/FtsJ